jgi:CO/xanthine dehydrogenase Mo-binding subunit
MTRSSVRNYQGIGAPLRRVEDKRFLTGNGRFVADIELSGALACALVALPARARGHPPD